jgi:hypothetical protein
MSDMSLRARSITEIVDAAFALYKRNPGQYMLVTAIAYSPALVATLMLGAGQLDNRTSMTGFVISILVSLIANALMTGIIVSLGSRVYLGDGADVPAAVRQALPRIPSLLVAMILLAMLYGIGALAFFVGFFYVAARYFAVVPVVVLEGASPARAFGRSSELAKGRKWHILGALVLVYGLYLLVSVGLTGVFALGGNVALVLLASTLLTIVAFPIVGLATMVLYYDARIRAEGFDLERMTQGLGGATPVLGDLYT